MFFTGAKRRHYELTLVSSNRMIPHYHLNLFFWIFFEINVEKFSNFRWLFSKPLAS